ncbi:MAG: hypothetical protein DMF25_10685, partial [Verrucomicrobia bacterium]
MNPLRGITLPITLGLLLTTLLLGCGAGEKKKMRILERADRYFKTGEYDKAKIEYLNLLRIDRNDATAIQQLGFIWFEEGAILQAYPYLSRARELVPDNIAVSTKLATVLAALGEGAKARQEAMSILQESADQEEALLVLADTARTDEEIEETQEQLRRIPEEKDLYYHLAWATLAIRQGDLAYAQGELEEALKSDP